MATEQDRERELRFYRRLPKAELHAHLNGCISIATMKKLMAQKPNLQIQNGMTVIDKGKKRTLDECFQMFQIIYQVTTRTEDILLITKDVIKEFADDGVKYLELRSTPREENSTGMTKRMYVETVLEGIKQCQEEGLDIEVRLLIAINRRDGPAVAKQTVKLAEEFLLSSDGVVVGLDLSGDPTAGHGQDFLEPLSEAKKAGLKLALHLCEIPNQEEETKILLGLPPDRIGHGTFLNSPAAGSEEIVSLVQQNHIPIEFCMTSNIKSQTVPSCDKHHFGYWYNLGHPAVLCVNNCGLQLVIQTSSIPEKTKPFEFRINKEQSSFHNRLLQHDLEKNYSGRQDNMNFGSSSSITFPVLQRTAEEKILNSDRLTLERQKLTVCPIIDGEDHLRLLNFQHNFITRIQNISNLHHLVFLDLYDNQIEEISGVSTLRSLRVLLLGKNRIKKISNLENLKNLDVLDLHGNQKDVDTLPCLQRLFLSFNNISRRKKDVWHLLQQGKRKKGSVKAIDRPCLSFNTALHD
ncbi:leucine-rich repeat-containing protein 49 isoform X11 [Haemorhous mexicanus]|uniref:leucine-rich repeat-containing protein 49 isoform X11 n=1 Tax=Haemorhous mexicanus TaxID=30427 RepID=UPI0028BEE2C8|nr:leucine-rich repeat-containing protein 49 isoform X11 [Haemorhous mexicanus]